MEKPQSTLSHDELLQILREQERLIKELNQEKDSIANFKFFVNEQIDLLCVIDTDFNFKIVNEGLARSLGYSKRELLSRPFLEFSHPDDLENTLRELVKLSHKNPLIEFENRYINKNGGIVFLKWIANLDPSNNLIRALARDSTEMRIKLLNSEKALNEVQRIAKIGSWNFNMERQELSVSNELAAIFEMDTVPNNPELYPKLLSCFLPDDTDKFKKNIYDCIACKIPCEMEQPILLNDNKTKWVYCSAVPELDKNHNIVGLKGIVQDITQKKMISESIKAKEKAEAANKAKSDFLSNMSHEIRTPLNGIVGFTDLLLRTNLEEDQLEYLKAVNISANTLMEIINNILDFSKIEAGELSLNYEDLDIGQLLHQIVNLFKYEANSKKLDLKLSIDPNVPKMLKADSFRLKQILVNLLSNAMKFTFSGYVKIKVILLEEDSMFAKIKFSVIDSGIGIKECNQKKIFKSFVQADSSTTRKYGGSGLGLAISSQLLNLQGSKLELSSTYGQGSEFYFTINFEKIPEAEDSIPIRGLLNHQEVLNSPAKPLILIAEDNHINMVLVKTLVNKLIKDCTLIEAPNGADAVRMALENIPDLILMDIHMPLKNGYDATVEIKDNAITKNIPVIALTAGNLNGEKEKCLEYGMSDFVAKPIIQKELEDVLLKWLKK